MKKLLSIDNLSLNINFPKQYRIDKKSDIELKKKTVFE